MKKFTCPICLKPISSKKKDITNHLQEHWEYFNEQEMDTSYGKELIKNIAKKLKLKMDLSVG